MGISCGGSSCSKSEIHGAGSDDDVCPISLTRRFSQQRISTFSSESPGTAAKMETEEGANSNGKGSGNGWVSVGSPARRPRRLKSMLSLPGTGPAKTARRVLCATLQKLRLSPSHDRSVAAARTADLSNPANNPANSSNSSPSHDIYFKIPSPLRGPSSSPLRQGADYGTGTGATGVLGCHEAKTGAIRSGSGDSSPPAAELHKLGVGRPSRPGCGAADQDRVVRRAADALWSHKGVCRVWCLPLFVCAQLKGEALEREAYFKNFTAQLFRTVQVTRGGGGRTGLTRRTPHKQSSRAWGRAHRLGVYARVRAARRTCRTTSGPRCSAA